jgi:D-3-phosphoglycerate dehydrogenase
MTPFKVALVAIDAPEVPEWVLPELAKSYIEIVVHECTTPQHLAEHASDADVVWVFGGSRVVSAETLGILRNCGAIVRTGSGTDNIPVEHATQLGIVVANTPDALSDAVASHAIALLLTLTRQTARQDRAVRKGIWDSKTGWPAWHLSESTLGLVAFGRIARKVARRTSGFEMNVLAYDPYVSAEEMSKYGVTAATLPELLTQSDFVSLHCPLTSETRHLVGEKELRLMKPSSLLINTSRGPVIDETALIRALKEGWIAGAGLDVFEQEPVARDNPLLQQENVVLTPHIGGYADQFYERMWRASVETVIDLGQGMWPRSFVNPTVSPRWALRNR